MLTYIHTDDKAYIYNKLTNEPKGSGELKIKIGVIYLFPFTAYALMSIFGNY